MVLIQGAVVGAVVALVIMASVYVAGALFLAALAFFASKRTLKAKVVISDSGPRIEHAYSGAVNLDTVRFLGGIIVVAAGAFTAYVVARKLFGSSQASGSPSLEGSISVLGTYVGYAIGVVGSIYFSFASTPKFASSISEIFRSSFDSHLGLPTDLIEKIRATNNLVIASAASMKIEPPRFSWDFLSDVDGDTTARQLADSVNVLLNRKLNDLETLRHLFQEAADQVVPVHDFLQGIESAVTMTSALAQATAEARRRITSDEARALILTGNASRLRQLVAECREQVKIVIDCQKSELSRCLALIDSARSTVGETRSKVAEFQDLLDLLSSIDEALNIDKNSGGLLHSLVQRGESVQIEKIVAEAIQDIHRVAREAEQRREKSHSEEGGSFSSKVIFDPNFPWADLRHIDGCFAYYGLSASATEDEVNVAFRKRAQESHSDKGGDAEEFKRANGARQRIKQYLRGRQPAG